MSTLVTIARALLA